MDSCKPAKGAHDGHAGLEQGVHLARVKHDIDGRNFLPLHAVQQAFLPGARPLGGRIDFHRGHSAIKKQIGHRRAIGTFLDALDQVTACVSGFVGKEWQL